MFETFQTCLDRYDYEILNCLFIFMKIKDEREPNYHTFDLFMADYVASSGKKKIYISAAKIKKTILKHRIRIFIVLVDSALM